MAWQRGVPVLVIAAALGAAAGSAWPPRAPTAWEATAVLRLPADPGAPQATPRGVHRAPSPDLLRVLSAAPLDAVGQGAVLSLRPLPALDADGQARLELRLAGPDPRKLLPALQALGAQARRAWLAHGAREAADGLPPGWSSPPSADALHAIPARSGLPVLGAFAGLLLAALALAARELRSDRLRDERDVQWSLGAPVLGQLPALASRARHVFAPTGGPHVPRAGTPD